MRADDIRPYTRTGESRLKPYQKVSNCGITRKSGCRGGYHPPAKAPTQLKRLSGKEKYLPNSLLLKHNSFSAANRRNRTELTLSARFFPSAAGDDDRGKRQHAEAIDQQRHMEERLAEKRRVKLIQYEKRQRDQRKNDANMRKKFF